MKEGIFNHSRQRRELISSALAELNRGQRVALATLVNIEGNAPYPLGSQMLITEQGRFIGQITGGCAEKAIADHGVAAIQTNQSATYRYGLNSPFFDIQLPCGSGIDVFIDVNQQQTELLAIEQTLATGKPHTNVLNTSCGEFRKTYLPTPKLIIAGQGPIFVSLGSLSLECGFDVLLIAQNESTRELAIDRGLSVQQLAHKTLIEGHCDRFTGVVSLFHEHDHEPVILSQALKSDAFYIGALGSQRTHLARLQSLASLGHSVGELERIHGPVGLRIKTRTPSEIAVSILAQLIDQWNKHSAQYDDD